MPKVSVIIPVFNADKYIREAIESVINQTFIDYEIVVVNDGSTDRTVEIIQPYEKNIGLKILHRNNSGPSKARNEGVRAARGEYCAFLDADDIMMPERLALQVSSLDNKAGVGLVYTDLMTFNERGIVHRSKKRFIRPYSGNVVEKLLIENFITTSTVMVRKECFERVAYFDETMKHSEDYKMWLSIAKRYEIDYLDLPLVKYRYHADSLSSDRIAIHLSSYAVAQEFWESNEEYRREKKLLYRMSMANHMVMLSNAYRTAGMNKESLRWLIKALQFYPLLIEEIKIPLRMISDSIRGV